jgi:ribonuclease J
MSRADEALVFAPLGGVGEIGMNLGLYGLGREGRKTWMAVDFGVSFASEEHLPGIDLILPDIRYLEGERRNLAGIVITHAHEDHFGALIDLWPRLKVPIYATPFTAYLVAEKLRERGLQDEADLRIMQLGETRQFGPFEVELVTLTHSIPASTCSFPTCASSRKTARATPAS